MDSPVLANQQKFRFISSVQTFMARLIGMDDKKVSRESMQLVLLDDNDFLTIRYLYFCLEI